MFWGMDLGKLSRVLVTGGAGSIGSLLVDALMGMGFFARLGRVV
jgi:nucleoside-diphosphate-sugar epimerase